MFNLMKKFLNTVLILLLFAPLTYAAAVADNVKQAVEKVFPNANFRFDGVIILPDSTVYLPLFPAKIINTENLEVKKTIPANSSLESKPDVVIFNNDFVLLKVIKDKNGNKTIFSMANPPDEIRTGLLPQDMLVPNGLIIPENLKSIAGNLNIVSGPSAVRVKNLKPVVENPSGSTLKTLSSIPSLYNKNFYMSSPYSKNIHVYNSDLSTSEYSFRQVNIPVSMKAYNNEFLLVTAFGKLSVDVISLADDEIIKQIPIKTQPDEILIDNKNKTAYISSSVDSSIYLVNLETMTLSKQIKIMGMCEKLTLSQDGTKLFYFDKKSNDVWAVELNNNYLLKEIGKFPNVSKIVYTSDKVYLASRTKNRIAIVNYDTLSLVNEIEICEKPVDMIVYKDRVYVLGAGDNSIQVIDANTDKVTDSIYLNTNGFSTKIIPLGNIALITDTKSALYTVFDMDTNKVLKTIPVDLPVNMIIVTEKVKKIND